MAKYFIVIVLFTCVALENISIYVNSQPSRHIDVNNYRINSQNEQQLLKQLQRHRHHHNQHNHHQQQQHNRIEQNHQLLHQLRIPEFVDNDARNEAAMEALRNYLFIKRHIDLKEEHLIKHKNDYIKHHSNIDRVNNDDDDNNELAIQQLEEKAKESQVIDDDEKEQEPNSQVQINDYNNNNNDDDNLNNVSPHSQHAIPKIGCAQCESSRRLADASLDDLTKLRIELIKKQILEKLDLKEPPKVTNINSTQAILEETAVVEQNEQIDEEAATIHKETNDYYAKTNKKFIFLQRDDGLCKIDGAAKDKNSICFSFKINEADVDSFDIQNAMLWLYTKNSFSTNDDEDDNIINPETIIISEIKKKHDNELLTTIRPIAMHTVNETDNEWTKINIEYSIKNWYSNRSNLMHYLKISCENCNATAFDEHYKPFITVNAQNRRRIQRPKRSINCSDQVNECCREKLYISFKDIGWDNWIIQPQGFTSYFCRGSCSSTASITQSSSLHFSFYRKYAEKHRSLEIIPCCTAQSYSSLDLLVRDTNSTSASLKTLPGMVVESCGCR